MAFPPGQFDLPTPAMDDTGEKKPSENFNKLDLTALSGFQFGTQWTGEKSSAGGKAEGEGRALGGTQEMRRDRRTFRRSVPSEDAPAEERRPTTERSPRQERPSRLHPSDESTPRHHGGPSRESRFQGGERHGGRPPGRSGHGERPERTSEHRGPAREAPPYVSPEFEVAFYPDDDGFTALLAALRRTPVSIELFRIAHLLLEKNDRFVVVVKRRPGENGKIEPIYLSRHDNLPFDGEEAAVRHAISSNLARFFDTEEVEIDPPKGSFPAIARCPVTGMLLAPPNYHRYNQILAQHHSRHIGRQPFERWKASLEMVRTPEAVQQWLDSMRKAVRFTAKEEFGGQKPVFLSQEDAAVFLLTQRRNELVSEALLARFPGRLIESLPPGEIRRAVEGALMAQRRFPLETANSLRGRLRRENFSLFKLPGRVPTYVSSVRPRARRAGETFATVIQTLFEIIDARPLLTYAELETEYLARTGETSGSKVGLLATPVRPEEDLPPKVGTETPRETLSSASTPEPESATVPETVKQSEPTSPPPTASEASPPTPNVAPAVREMRTSLAWLVHEGYIIELHDRRFYALPPRAEETRLGGRPGGAAAVIDESGSDPQAAQTDEAPPTSSPD